MLKTKFCERFALEYPIIQAPMVGVSNTRLAAEVLKAGALPSMGCGAMNAAALDKSISEFMVLSGTEKAPLININFFSHQEEELDSIANTKWLKELAPLFEGFETQAPTSLNVTYQSLLTEDERVAVLLEKRPQIVSFHFGLPSASVLQKLKDAGIVIFASACDVDEAQQLESAGVDYIVAQGYEAGGHRGIFNAEHDPKIGTLELLKQIKQHCVTPVIAAGGVMDGQEIRVMLEHGAEAVQLGTAFVLCPESSTSETYRGQLREHAKGNSETVVSADISGRPARGLRTKLSDLGARLIQDKGLKRPIYPALYDVNKQLNDAALKQGDEGYGAYWSGTGLAKIREMPAQDLIALLAKEATE